MKKHFFSTSDFFLSELYFFFSLLSIAIVFELMFWPIQIAFVYKLMGYGPQNVGDRKTSAIALSKVCFS